jgi:hypothetical protein
MQEGRRFIMTAPVLDDVFVSLDGAEGVEQLADKDSHPGRCSHEQMNRADIAIVTSCGAHSILDRQGYICGFARRSDPMGIRSGTLDMYQRTQRGEASLAGRKKRFRVIGD